MPGKIDSRLAELKIELPKAAAPVANYVPVVIAGKTAYTSGQVTVLNGEFKYIGKLGKEFGIEDGQKAARLCGLNVIAQVKTAIGIVLFTLGARLIPAVETALITALDAPLAPVWVWLAFGETPGRATLLGGFLVVGAVLANVSLGAKSRALAN